MHYDDDWARPILRASTLGVVLTLLLMRKMWYAPMTLKRIAPICIANYNCGKMGTPQNRGPVVLERYA